MNIIISQKRLIAIIEKFYEHGANNVYRDEMRSKLKQELINIDLEMAISGSVE